MSARVSSQPIFNIKPKDGNTTDRKQWHRKGNAHHTEQRTEQDDRH
jgi:hypothetical protein